MYILPERRVALTITPRERIIELGEFRISYATAGEGPDVVLIHSSDPRDNWKSWLPLSPLGERYRMTMPDLIGFGRSTRPTEAPNYEGQAAAMRDLMDRLGIQAATLIGSGWGGQVSLEMAIEQPGRVRNMVLISSTYDKSQLPRLAKLRRPVFILWAEDDMVAQLKAGYLLRDAIGTSRLEVLGNVAKDPRYDFRIAHQLERFRSEILLGKISAFLEDPEGTVREPPAIEPELRGMALKVDDDEKTDG